MDLLGTYQAGISNNDYHAMKDYFSSSQVKEAHDSASSFRWYLKNGKKADSVWSPTKRSAMDFGSLVHALVLEPETVMDDFMFVETNGVSFRSNDGKALKAKWINQSTAAKKILLTNNDHACARLCRDAIMNHEFASELFKSKGRPEISGFFHDEDFGLDMRFRPDYLVDDYEGASAIVDIKTTEAFDDFKKKAYWEFKYGLSAHMYIKGHKIVTGEEVPFFFVVAESVAPYRVMVRKAESILRIGENQYNRSMANVALAVKNKSPIVTYQEAKYDPI